MMKNKSMTVKTYWTFILLLSLVANVQAMEIKGISFADRHPVGQTELTLTGAAVLKWGMLFDVYAGAFYLPHGVSGAEWTSNIPKRLELSYFRNFKAEDFASSSDNLLRENLATEDYQSLAGRLQLFYGLFRDVKPGDRYSLTYEPATGTELRLNDKLLGMAPGADFAVAYFGLWLGSKPINKGFRDRLLGKDS
ncbi:MAG: chalcone isomerase family protein [Desulfuromusa sp.]|nr:chalcone isomerase family protein [Desulfuromusa sp.]